MRPGSGSSRIAAVWHSNSTFSINVNITDGASHELSLYLLDWSNLGRVEKIQLTSATNGTVLDTETPSSFSGGVYYSWVISGDVVITFTTVSGPNTVVSGLFFDPVPAAPLMKTAAFTASHTSTQSGAAGRITTQSSTAIGESGSTSTTRSSVVPRAVAPAPRGRAIPASDRLVHDVALEAVSSDERRLLPGSGFGARSTLSHGLDR